MTERYFIEDQLLVKDLLSRLKFYRKESHECGELYIDPKTAQKWEKYEFEFEDQLSDGIGLRRHPYPNVETILRIAFEAVDMDEVSGAAALLCELDRKGQYLRDQLLSIFEHELTTISFERFEIIYWRTEFYDATNNQLIVGKTYNKINEEAQYYLRTAETFNELRKRKMDSEKNEENAKNYSK